MDAIANYANAMQSWEVWMVEVVSVACLSVACKLDEVNIPSLHDLQVRTWCNRRKGSKNTHMQFIVNMSIILLKRQVNKSLCSLSRRQGLETPTLIDGKK